VHFLKLETQDKTLPFWDVMQHRLLVRYHCCRAAYWSRLQDPWQWDW